MAFVLRLAPLPALGFAACFGGALRILANCGTQGTRVGQRVAKVSLLLHCAALVVQAVQYSKVK